MNWSAYGSFLAFAVVLILIPGPDFAVVTKNTLFGGRRRGLWTGIGVSTSNAVQGTAAAAGLGALIVSAQPAFEALRWAGVAYLIYLGVQAARSALAGRYPPLGGRSDAALALGGWRQGFLSNITNPKVLVFYLAVLPQFVPAGAGVPVLVLFALSHALLGLLHSVLLVSGLHRVRRVLQRRRVRRTLDGVTAGALVGFGVVLAAENAGA